MAMQADRTWSAGIKVVAPFNRILLSGLSEDSEQPDLEKKIIGACCGAISVEAAHCHTSHRLGKTNVLESHRIVSRVPFRRAATEDRNRSAAFI
jgi:hypothetical protein